jgi:uncharacterized membrane protein YebE (DUF533 family)
MEVQQFQDKRFNFRKIIANELQFKKQLAIGEDAYTSLKVKRKLFDAWDTAGAAGTAAGVASTSTVASTFFSTFWTTIGIGTATTPIGWIIAAGALGGAAWLGFSRFIKSSDTSKVVVIPNYINTPIDLLATTLFDMIAFIALKVAQVDGSIDDSEREFIARYLIEEWGYDAAFVEQNMPFIESNLNEKTLAEQVRFLADFQEKNPDCNQKEMTKQFISFITALIEVDGVLDEREEMAFEQVKNSFDNRETVKNKIGQAFSGFKSLIENGLVPSKNKS